MQWIIAYSRLTPNPSPSFTLMSPVANNNRANSHSLSRSLPGKGFGTQGKTPRNTARGCSHHSPAPSEFSAACPSHCSLEGRHFVNTKNNEKASRRIESLSGARLQSCPAGPCHGGGRPPLFLQGGGGFQSRSACPACSVSRVSATHPHSIELRTGGYCFYS